MCSIGFPHRKRVGRPPISGGNLCGPLVSPTEIVWDAIHFLSRGLSMQYTSAAPPSVVSGGRASRGEPLAPIAFRHRQRMRNLRRSERQAAHPTACLQTAKGTAQKGPPLEHVGACRICCVLYAPHAPCLFLACRGTGQSPQCLCVCKALTRWFSHAHRRTTGGNGYRFKVNHAHNEKNRRRPRNHIPRYLFGCLNSAAYTRKTRQRM